MTGQSQAAGEVVARQRIVWLQPCDANVVLQTFIVATNLCEVLGVCFQGFKKVGPSLQQGAEEIEFEFDLWLRSDACEYRRDSSLLLRLRTGARHHRSPGADECSSASSNLPARL